MVSIGRVLWAVLKMDGPRWLAETTEQAHDEAHRHKEKERERGRKERDASRAHTLRCVHVGRDDMLCLCRSINMEEDAVVR